MKYCKIKTRNVFSLNNEMIQNVGISLYFYNGKSYFGFDLYYWYFSGFQVYSKNEKILNIHIDNSIFLKAIINNIYKKNTNNKKLNIIEQFINRKLLNKRQEKLAEKYRYL